MISRKIAVAVISTGVADWCRKVSGDRKINSSLQQHCLGPHHKGHGVVALDAAREHLFAPPVAAPRTRVVCLYLNNNIRDE